jgi:putative oxidoreductase
MRIVLGIIMLAHSWSKVTNISHHVGLVQSLGMPGWLAYLSAAAEFGGGIAVLVGLLTRLGALGIAIDLAVAIEKIHWKNGLRGPNGMELPLAVATLAFALIFFGAGPISLDGIVFRGRGGKRGPGVSS